MYSRLSMPMIAFFLVIIAGIVGFCVYQWAGWQVKPVEEISVPPISHSDFQNFDEVLANVSASESSNAASVANNAVQSTASQSSSSVDPAILEGWMLWRAYWSIHTRNIPKLLRATHNKNTAAVLDDIGRSSIDELRQATPLNAQWIQYTKAGEREGARAISFEYAKYPDELVNAMAWAMVANAISPNEYYLYLCNLHINECDELVFERASYEALLIIGRYGFVLAGDY